MSYTIFCQHTSACWITRLLNMRNLLCQANLAHLCANVARTSPTFFSSNSHCSRSGPPSKNQCSLQNFIQNNEKAQSQQRKSNYLGTSSDKSAYKNKKPGGGSTIKCQVCGKLGHGAQKCFQLRELLLGKTGASSPIAFVTDATASIVLHDNSGSPHWLLSSRAIHHLTGDSSNLHSTTPYTGTESVTVGNGVTLPIQNIGSTSMHVHYHVLLLSKVLHTKSVFQSTICSSIVN